MTIFKNKLIQTISFYIVLTGLFFVSLAEAGPVQKRFQKAVEAKDCETVKSLFPDLIKENLAYYSTLSNFYEKGICLTQDYKKAFEALNKIPDDEFGFKELKLGQYYSNGWGVPINIAKAKEYFEQAVKEIIISTGDISQLKFGIEILLGTKKIPNNLENLVSDYENIEWSVEQKFDFAMKFITHTKNILYKKSGYRYLMKLVSQYNHPPSAYALAKWYIANKEEDNAKTYFYIAAQAGNAKAQADIGRLYFFAKSHIFKKRIAYEMLYRAHLAGEVDQSELIQAEEMLNKLEIQLGREEATRPLPQK